MPLHACALEEEGVGAGPASLLDLLLRTSAITSAFAPARRTRGMRRWLVAWARNRKEFGATTSDASCAEKPRLSGMHSALIGSRGARHMIERSSRRRARSGGVTLAVRSGPCRSTRGRNQARPY